MEAKRWGVINSLDILKLLIISLLFYNFFYIRIFGEIAIIHWLLLLLSLCIAVSTKGIKGVIYTDEESITLFWTFSFVTAITGAVVASNYSNLAKAVIDNFEYAIIIGMIIWISRLEKNAEWIVKAFIAIAVLCAVTALVQGTTFNGRLILGTTGNSNDLGIKMVYGIFCVLILLIKPMNLFKRGVLVLGLLTMLTVIIQTASRKSLLVAGVLIIYFLLFVMPKSLKKKWGPFSFFLVIVIAAIACIGIARYYSEFTQTKMFHRFTYVSDGAENRTELLREAFSIFKRNPIFGVGLNNYRNVSSSGLYSHSTIGETLSCTGICGSMIWLVYIYSFIKKFIILIKQRSKANADRVLLCLGGFIGILLFSLGVILYYDYDSMICLTIIAVTLTIEMDSIYEIDDYS